MSERYSQAHRPRPLVPSTRVARCVSFGYSTHSSNRSREVSRSSFSCSSRARCCARLVRNCATSASWSPDALSVGGAASSGVSCAHSKRAHAAAHKVSLCLNAHVPAVSLVRRAYAPPQAAPPTSEHRQAARGEVWHVWRRGGGQNGHAAHPPESVAWRGLWDCWLVAAPACQVRCGANLPLQYVSLWQYGRGCAS